MKTNVIDDSRNPSFNSVLNLTNRTFDGNIVEGRGATEDQLLVVYNKIKEVKEWLDENGCDNDPYTYLRQQIEELQVKFEECCGTDWSANVTADMYERMQLLEDRIDVCCNVDHGASATAAVHTKLNELEQRITDCCEALDDRVAKVISALRSTLTNSPSADANTCDGNEITVTFEWTAYNKTTGKATATSSMSNHSIVSYDFLVSLPGGGYVKAKKAGLGDFHWEIDNSGNVTMKSGGAGPAVGIVATDDHGCEGTNNTGFWSTGSAVNNG